MSKKEILNLFSIACNIAKRESLNIVPYPKGKLICDKSTNQYINELSKFIKNPEYSYLAKNKYNFKKLNSYNDYKLNLDLFEKNKL